MQLLKIRERGKERKNKNFLEANCSNLENHDIFSKKSSLTVCGMKNMLADKLFWSLAKDSVLPSINSTSISVLF